MRDLEAKDFIVERIAQQAMLEHVPLSSLEKRMMYFTESGEMREDALELNDEFEAQHNTDEYEQKNCHAFEARLRSLTKGTSGVCAPVE